MGRLGKHDPGHVVVAECDDERLGAGDRAEQRQHEVGEDVSVAVQGRDHHRIAARGQKEGERRVDQLWLVRDVWMPLGRRVHLLLQHPLVDGADGVLRPAEDLRPRAFREPEGELRDRRAHPSLDALRAERRFVGSFALAPLLGAVRVADSHADDGDRRVHAADRSHARDAAAGADDHLSVDLLAEDPVR